MLCTESYPPRLRSAFCLPSSFLFVIGCLPVLAMAPKAPAQVEPISVFPFGGVPGVYLDTDGAVRVRQVDTKQELASMQARLRAAARAKDDPLVYISLPKLFAQVRMLQEAGKPLPEELKYLGGMTRLQYVFVLGEQKDLVIAGPAEQWHVLRQAGDPCEFVVGARTGRPVMQLDDLVVAMRTAREGGGKVFGCGIWPSPDSLRIADDIERRMVRNTRAERMAALQQELGPQEVKIFGARPDTRLAFVCVAADYELKRLALGIDRAPVAGVGNGVDHSRSAANKFWFESAYDPLLVSADGNAYELRGPRLLVRAGQFDFDPRGATEKAKTFAANFTKHVAELAAAQPLIAELQNVADESLLANLIRHDRLAQKIDWDDGWAIDEAGFHVATIPVPRTAQTLVGFTNGSLVAGGVHLMLGAAVDEARQVDQKRAIDAARQPLLAGLRPRADAGPLFQPAR